MGGETEAARLLREANAAYARASALAAPEMGEALRSRLSVLLTPVQAQPARRRRRAA